MLRMSLRMRIGVSLRMRIGVSLRMSLRMRINVPFTDGVALYL